MATTQQYLFQHNKIIQNEKCRHIVTHKEISLQT